MVQPAWIIRQSRTYRAGFLITCTRAVAGTTICPSERESGADNGEDPAVVSLESDLIRLRRKRRRSSCLSGLGRLGFLSSWFQHLLGPGAFLRRDGAAGLNRALIDHAGIQCRGRGNSTRHVHETGDARTVYASDALLDPIELRFGRLTVILTRASPVQHPTLQFLGC